jgi:glycosyltransferase involved in cell wall biosynthesis
MVTPAYPPSIGGVEVCAREVATRLSADGLRVRVLTVDTGHDLPPREFRDGIGIRRVRGYPRGWDGRLAPGVAVAVARTRADLVHVQSYQTLVAPLALAAAARRRIPYVLTFHGGGHSSDRRQAFRGRQLQILAPLRARADTLVATADWEIDHYSAALGLPRGRFVRIPNGSDLPPAGERAATGGAPLIVSLGRAERYKGHHRVLAAMPHVLTELPEAQLWIAGDGPYAGALRRQAEELGIADRVEVGAIHDRSAYAHRLAGAAAAALLSDFETHPIAALEAISLGVPMLVADNSGMAELARDGHARAVTLQDGSRRHAAELIRLIRGPPPAGPSPQLGSWAESAAAYGELYEAVLRRAGARR